MKVIDLAASDVDGFWRACRCVAQADGRHNAYEAGVALQRFAQLLFWDENDPSHKAAVAILVEIGKLRIGFLP